METGKCPHGVGRPDGATPGVSQCPSNHLGKIAESYDALHNIPLLRSARQSASVPRGTYNSAVQAVFQAAEVALLKLADLSRRASCRIARQDLAGCQVTMRWSRGFHHILRRLGVTASTLQLHRHQTCDNRATDAVPGSAARMTIEDSPGLQSYIEATVELEAFLGQDLEALPPDALRSVIGNGTLDDLRFSLLHMHRLSAHDGMKWEADLYSVPLDPGMPGFNECVAPNTLRAAVEESILAGGTFFGEFVALHQIPEILCDEANDHVEQAILRFRSDQISEAIEQVGVVRALLDAFVQSQRIMADCLTTGDYHAFRENLGPASGIHSLAIRQHMFQDLFAALWNNLESRLSDGKDLSLQEVVLQLSSNRHRDSKACLWHILLNEIFELHQLHEEWRHEHLHMPRNCLGAGGTKSMIGVDDGLQTVVKMRKAANSQPALRHLHEARGFRLGCSAADALLAAHHAADESLDSHLLHLTGEITRESFPKVQKQPFQPFRSKHPIRTV